MENTPEKAVSKVTCKSLMKEEVTFEQIKAIIQELKIDSKYKLDAAIQDKVIKMPPYSKMKSIFMQIRKQNLEVFFEFNRVKNHRNKLDKLQDADFIKELKNWCQENNIKTIRDYKKFAFKPKQFPTKEMITKFFGNEYFTKVIGLTNPKEHKNSIPLDKEFQDILKNWCLENNIHSTAKYVAAEKPEGFPSSRDIKKAYGDLFLSNLYFTIRKKGKYLPLEDARKICLQNRIYTLAKYVKFYKKYNSQNEKKLPFSINEFYNITWVNFITSV